MKTQTMKKMMLGVCGLGLAVGLTACGSSEAVDIDVSGMMQEVEAFVEGNFPNTMTLAEDDLTLFYPELDVTVIEEFGGMMPMMQSTSEITIFEVKEGSVDEVVAALEARKAMQMETFEHYLPDQYEIVKDSKIIQGKTYAAFISAESDIQDEVTDIIKQGTK